MVFVPGGVRCCHVDGHAGDLRTFALADPGAVSHLAAARIRGTGIFCCIPDQLRLHGDLCVADGEKDIRLFAQNELIGQEMDRAKASFHGILQRVTETVGRYNGLRAALNGLMTGLVYLLLGMKAMLGNLTIGNVVQQGDHETLAADADGLYYKLWQAQAKYYH